MQYQFTQSDIDRLWSRVDKPEPDSCWLWQGSVNWDGYGMIKVGSRKDGSRHNELTHRMSWMLTHGREPTECVLHTCDNPPCCNPAHLFEGTRVANNSDKMTKGRHRLPGTPIVRSNAKLTEDQVREIRRRFASGRETKTMLAVSFGVGFSTIKKVVGRESWKAVAD